MMHFSPFQGKIVFGHPAKFSGPSLNYTPENAIKKEIRLEKNLKIMSSKKLILYIRNP